MRLTYKQSIDGYTDVGLNPGVTVEEAICKLADLEDADSVEVVRCKDCKHRGGNLCPMETVELYPWFGSKNDAFCSYGERKDGNA